MIWCRVLSGDPCRPINHASCQGDQLNEPTHQHFPHETTTRQYLPYCPFNKSDRLGRAAELSQSAFHLRMRGMWCMACMVVGVRVNQSITERTHLKLSHAFTITTTSEQRRLREDANRVTNEGLHYDYDKAEDKSFRVVDSGTGKRKGAFHCVLSWERVRLYVKG